MQCPSLHKILMKWFPLSDTWAHLLVQERELIKTSFTFLKGNRESLEKHKILDTKRKKNDDPKFVSEFFLPAPVHQPKIVLTIRLKYLCSFNRSFIQLFINLLLNVINEWKPVFTSLWVCCFATWYQLIFT